MIVHAANPGTGVAVAGPLLDAVRRRGPPWLTQPPSKTGRPLWWAAGLSLLLVIVAALVVVRPWLDSERIEVPAPQRADREERAAWGVEALQQLQNAVHDRSGSGLPPLGQTIVANARELEIRDFSLRYLVEDEAALVAGSDTWVAEVAATWRFGGFDDAAAATDVSG